MKSENIEVVALQVFDRILYVFRRNYRQTSFRIKFFRHGPVILCQLNTLFLGQVIRQNVTTVRLPVLELIHDLEVLLSMLPQIML